MEKSWRNLPPHVVVVLQTRHRIGTKSNRWQRGARYTADYDARGGGVDRTRLRVADRYDRPRHAYETSVSFGTTDVIPCGLLRQPHMDMRSLRYHLASLHAEYRLLSIL